MKFTLEVAHILTVSFLTFFVLFFVDIPMEVGYIHWVPELYSIFLLSRYSGKHFLTKTKWSIFCAVIVFPILWYQSLFGFLTASIFGSSIIAGFMSVDITTYLKKRQQIDNVIFLKQQDKLKEELKH